MQQFHHSVDRGRTHRRLPQLQKYVVRTSTAASMVQSRSLQPLAHVIGRGTRQINILDNPAKVARTLRRSLNRYREFFTDDSNPDSIAGSLNASSNATATSRATPRILSNGAVVRPSSMTLSSSQVFTDIHANSAFTGSSIKPSLSSEIVSSAPAPQHALRLNAAQLRFLDFEAAGGRHRHANGAMVQHGHSHRRQFGLFHHLHCPYIRVTCQHRDALRSNFSDDDTEKLGGGVDVSTSRPIIVNMT